MGFFIGRQRGLPASGSRSPSHKTVRLRRPATGIVNTDAEGTSCEPTLALVSDVGLKKIGNDACQKISLYGSYYSNLESDSSIVGWKDISMSPMIT